ncbi:MAG: calcium-binding protein, partial [Pseudanabaenaceae cyanobacterium]
MAIFKSTPANEIIKGTAGAGDAVSYEDAKNGVFVDLVAGLATGDGVDTLVNIEGVIGSQFNDLIVFAANTKTVNGGAGQDVIFLTNASPNLVFDKDDSLKGVEFINATFVTTAVNINLKNETEGVTIFGSPGNDQITTGSGNDNVFAGTGNDLIDTQAGDDYIDAGPGDDIINAGDGTNKVLAGPGNDIITTGVGNDYIEGNEGNDIITAGAGNDYIIGGTGNDIIDAGSGNDIVVGFEGADQVNGGTGTDVIILLESSASLNTAADGDINSVEIINAGLAQVGVAIDLSKQNEGFTVFGSEFNDIITGGAGADQIFGGKGDDKIIGFTVGDKIDGGNGTNTLEL